ncbi:tRNA/rRNA methyltransferase [cyanobacterium endosymbiont of Rhopalodia gibberula]|uniref:tRNA (cytidine(34)-2'-O)-methyltransferase n=1 Tax=cyanobacterium endosymbiont of Rhopalodia gibberula TaxID=1763363 RepID=UPI000DC6DD37|nr:tRNA (cytidine(34)-2'-O)-methyltransferase [cyanobacterium endosymbiont of Rhopalodia gibberula]BBA80294.1 tRNA/rRNA methyltransferase [cyanobacterium endosymbiont of Rhopalodia gibberula]
MPRIILINPQIPPNTGNIARTCAATNTELHLVGPLGFELSNRYLKRAGLDYWPYVNLDYHNSLEDFLAWHEQQGGRLLGFSVRGRRSYLEWTFQDSDWLLFGSETEGLPQSLLANCQETLYIPISHPQVRSLNLSVSVTIGLFEAQRQLKMI